MKKALLILSILMFIACDKDELKIGETPTDEIVLSDCTFTLKNVKANDNIVIDCLLDLKGETINLPSNVTLKNERGGKIFNGSLVFNKGKIDGELLNIDLKIEGDVELSNNEFLFFPEKWDITEGETSVEIALNNKENLQNAIDLVKKLKGNTLSIDKLDAYFEIGRDQWVNAAGYNKLAIHLPSNFHLKMTENTFLRVQPSYWPRGYLLSIYIKENVKVTGGNLIGDRFEHDYTDILDEVGISRGTHEWPTLLYVAGSKNVVATNIILKESTGDGIVAGASDGFRFSPGNPFNKNITFISCTVDANRRNNISVTDGEDIFITNCVIKNSGDIKDREGSNGWKGTSPKTGIDIEPFRGRNPDGSEKNFELTKNVKIDGCTFRNNQVGSIIDYSGINTTMSNNNSDRGFFSSFSTGAKFINNTFIGNERAKSEAAITTGELIVEINGVKTELSTNNTVKGNKVEGFNIGVIVRGNDGIIEDNIINESLFRGIQVKGASRAVFKNNKIASTFQNSASLSITNNFGENLTFINENYTNLRRAVSIFDVNTEIPYITSSITFDDCTFKSVEGYDIFFKNTPNVTVKNSKLINTKIETIDCVNFKDINNVILP